MSETSEQKQKRLRRLRFWQGMMSVGLVGITAFSFHEYWIVTHGNTAHRTPEDLALGFVAMSLMALAQSVLLWSNYRDRLIEMRP